MIGRATFGRPWIFKEINDVLGVDNQSSSLIPHPSSLKGPGPLTIDDKIDILEEQLRINIERISEMKGGERRDNEYRGILHTRRHLAASPIFKGIPDFRQTRIAMLRAESTDELIDILERCRTLIPRP